MRVKLSRDRLSSLQASVGSMQVTKRLVGNANDVLVQEELAGKR